jgi:hypothetical protein
MYTRLIVKPAADLQIPFIVENQRLQILRLAQGSSTLT